VIIGEKSPFHSQSLTAFMRQAPVILGALRVSAVSSSQGFSTILPNIWLFSMYSWAARVSLKGNV
jgi:hypothetical protein